MSAHSCFGTTVAELNNCKRPKQFVKPKVFTLWPCTQKAGHSMCYDKRDSVNLLDVLLQM